MLDSFEDVDLAACSDTWEKPNEYNVFTTAKKEKAEEGKDDAEAVNPQQTPEAIKTQSEKMIEETKNPYFYLYHWCEGELFDIQAVMIAIANKDKANAQIKKSEKMKASQEKESQAAKQGRKTVKTMFKKDVNTEKMDQNVENVSHIFYCIYNCGILFTGKP